SLKLGLRRVDDAAGVDRRVVAHDLDFAGLEIDFNFGCPRGLVPVHGAETLTGLGVEATLAQVHARAEQIAAVRRTHELTHANGPIGCATHAPATAGDLQVRAIRLQAIGAQLDELRADLAYCSGDGGAHRVRRAAGARLLVVGRDVGIDVRDRHSLRR